MRERQNFQISESEDSEEEPKSPKPSTSKVARANNRTSASSDSSSSSEESRAPTPPPNPKRSSSASPKKKVFGNPLEKFVNENPNLTKLVANDVVSKHEDVCLLEIPKNINPECFLDKVVNFDKRTKIKINKTKYIIEPSYEELKPINLLTDKLKIIHPLSVLKLRENPKHKQESEAVEFESVIPSLPDNLKVRHPLFGSQYKPKIVLDEEIQKKLDNAIEVAVQKMKKKKHKKEKHEFSASSEGSSGKKKKKHKRERAGDESGFGSAETDADQELNEDQPENAVEESIFTLLENHISGKKKKGHKNIKEEVPEQEQNESQVTLDLHDYESFHNISGEKKHKKKKKDKSKIDLEENLKHSESFADNNSFSEEKHERRKKIKEEKINSSDFEEESVGKKKKHKSSFKEEMNISQVNVNAKDSENKSFKSEKRKHKNSVRETEPEETDFIKSKPEKKRKASIANSTVISDFQLPIFEFDVSGITSQDSETSKNEEIEGKPVKEESMHKHKKKKKEKSFDDKSLIKQNSINEDGESGEYAGNESVESGKKKKKKHDVDGGSPRKKIKKEKKDKDEATNSLILDILNKVKSEMDTSALHKKKKN